MGSGYLNVMFFNANGLGNKRAQLEAYLETNETDLCFVQETKNATPSIHGYSCELIDSRVENNGGGLCTYVKDGLNVTEKWRLNDNVIQAVGIMINDTLIINVYRPPQSNLLEHREDNAKFWKEISSLPYRNIILMGDFNLNATNVNAFSTRNGPAGITALNELEKKHFMNLVDKPTFRTGSYLDWLLTTNSDYILNVEVDKHSDLGSDHYPIRFKLLQPGMRLSPNFITIRKLKNANWGKYRRMVKTYELYGETTNEKMINLSKDLLCMFDIVAPKIKINARERLPYDNSDSLNLQAKLKMLRKKKHKSESEKEEIRKLENELCQLRLDLRIIKESKVINTKGNAAIARYRKATKKTIKKIKDDKGEMQTEPSEIVKVFRDNLQAKNIIEQPIGLEIDFEPNCFSLANFTITTREIECIIENMKTNSAGGPDDINPTMIKKAKTSLARKLCPIFNQIVQEGVYPECWKETTITPILKKGSPSMISNYRNIQCSSCIGKIFEAIVHEKLYDFAEDRELFPSNQHGFRRKHSVMTNLMEFYSKVAFNVDNKKPVDVIFIDFSDAFGMMHHEMLLSKLSKMNIRGKMLNLLASYLHQRRGKFKHGDTRSDDVIQVGGSPQGGLLSPCLFALFTADLETTIRQHCSNDIMTSYYADDSKLGRVVTGEKSGKELQKALDIVCTWTGLNRMMLNVSKTKVLHIGYNSVNFEYNVKDERIESVEEMRDLGVIINKRLSWDSHVEKCVAKARAKFMEVKGKFYLANFKLFKQLYQCYLEPILLFGAPLYSGAKMETLAPLQRFQQYVFRNRSPKPEETEDWLPFDILSRANMLTVSFCHSIIHKHSILDYSMIYTNMDRMNPRTLEMLYPRYSMTQNKSEFNFPKFSKCLWKKIQFENRITTNKLTFKKSTRKNFRDPRTDIQRRESGYSKIYDFQQQRNIHSNARYAMAYR